MLKENTTPNRRKSALERRVDMGLDDPTGSTQSIEVDLEEFVVDEADEIDTDEK